VSSGPATERESELLEVVDETGRVLRLAPRSECHGNPSLVHRAVHVFVFDRAGRVFLQKRSLSKRIQPGKWDTSVGGHVDPGESYEAAAARELQEELGVELTKLGSLGQLEHRHDYVWRTHIETERVRTFELTCDGPFRLHPEEIDDGRFWTEAELRTAVGQGVLTANLEHELRLMRILR
jgi:isopentenyl-diphosphate delta-isomerase type 1